MWLPRSLSLLLVLLLTRSGSGCVFCRRHDRNLKDRFTKLCKDYMEATGAPNCTRHPGPSNFNPYGLDPESLLLVTEKTHRIFRVYEITRNKLGIAEYWDWLHEAKLMEYSWEALCPPVCKDTTILYNCTLCLRRKMKCWSLKKCYPESLDLNDTLKILHCCSAMSMMVGIITFYF
ncbi:sperm-egg fusion protein TMEM95, partial [Ascaphus truei]|uniref:sperm-egg fusion protein TMEM95 n=1 Tax=Ascaphus truei TaxID=8439 RepID=UPI003F59A5AA